MAGRYVAAGALSRFKLTHARGRPEQEHERSVPVVGRRGRRLPGMSGKRDRVGPARHHRRHRAPPCPLLWPVGPLLPRPPDGLRPDGTTPRAGQETGRDQAEGGVSVEYEIGANHNDRNRDQEIKCCLLQTTHKH